MKRRLVLALAVTGALGTLPVGAQAATVVVKSTTDTVDSGLLEGLMRPAYKQATGNDLNYLGEGTGAALNDAAQNGADVVITHDPSAEQSFVNNGYSLEPQGRAIFYSDYVVIGPASDPAGVFSGTAPAHDVVEAYEKIAAAGANNKAHFISRTGSAAAAPGTTAQEERIWNLANTLALQPAKDPGATSDEKQPDNGSGGYPSWYVATGAGKSKPPGQKEAVQAASACAPSPSTPDCYTMTDRGTYNALSQATPNTIPNLKIVDDKNSPSARGGENFLVNPFSAYVVNPNATFATKSHDPNADLGRNFVDFLTSADFQGKVDNFPSAADPAFHSDSIPAVIGAPPTTALAGSTVPISVTVTNKVPGGGPVAQPGPGGTVKSVTAVSGMSVQLQQSTDGKTFTDVGGPVTTDAAGKASFAPQAGGTTTTYRVSLPAYQQFSPGQVVLGVTAVTPVSGPVPMAPTQPLPLPGVPDKTPPRISKVKFSAKKLSFSLSEAGTVKVTIQRKVTRTVKGRKTTGYKTVKRITLTSSRAGTVSKRFAQLKVATYRVILRATDRAGNAKVRTDTVVLKAAKKKKKTRR